MALSLSGETVSLFGHGERDCEVARPRPQRGGVGDRHLQQLPAVLKVGVPRGLGSKGGREGGRGREGET